ncbi:MAG: class I mannose-6-phosphate isomerase [Mesotoga infera]
MSSSIDFSGAINISMAANIFAVKGMERILEFLFARRRKRPEGTFVIAIDGFTGNDWKRLMESIEEFAGRNLLAVKIYDFDKCRRSDEKIESLLASYLGEDAVFGKVFRRDIATLFSSESIAVLKADIGRERESKRLDAILVVGWGCAQVAMRGEYDLTVYFDLTREEALRRYKMTGPAFGTQSIGPKRLYYIDFPVSEKHRRRLLDSLDFYVDAGMEDTPVLLGVEDLREIAREISSKPFRLKPIYEPGPWGGQWLKRVRHLPEEWPNCAWSYEVIAPEMSLLVKNHETTLELPWNLFFDLAHESVMGEVSKDLFGGEFPIRFDYLDTMDGGDLSIQVHPPTGYIKRNFNERYHQGEMYYIVDCKSDRRVNLGLRDNASIDQFRAAAVKAEREGIAFDYTQYVHSIPVARHDILMIPPGTVHGSREGLVVLEISATTYRYTFKIYDHLRPDLNGVMRPIHIDHAFKVIRTYRRGKRVERQLKPKPSLKACGEGWAEYLIATDRSFFHEVYRLELETGVTFETGGRFHILTLVGGESVKIISGGKELRLGYSETVIVPASAIRYTIEAGGGERCVIVKARLK